MLQRAGLLWLRSLQANSDPAALETPRPRDVLLGCEVDDDVLLANQADRNHAQNPDLDADTPWVAWNQVQRSKSRSFLQSDFLPQLLIGCISIQLTSHVLHVVERVAGARFTRKQWWERLHARPALHRVLALCGVDIAGEVLRRAEDLLANASSYSVLPRLACTWRTLALAFTMVSRSISAMEFYVFKAWRSLPLSIFSLLAESGDTTREKVAENLLKVPACMRCSWSQRFLKRFHSTQLLTSKACLTLLFAIAMSMRMDISDVECKHASVKRLQRSRAATHIAEVSQVSADFLLQNVRKHSLHAASLMTPLPADVCQPASVRARKKKRRGGGGVGRCVLSELLRAQQELPAELRLPRPALFRAAHARVRELRASKGPEWERVLRKAKVATMSHRAGGASFGAKRLRSTSSTPAVLKRARCVLAAQDARGEAGLAENSLRSMVVQEASSALQAALGTYKTAVRQEAAAEGIVEQDLVKWSKNESASEKCSLFPGLAREHLPPGRTGCELGLSVEQFVAPVEAFAKRTLSSSARGILTSLGNAWSQRHTPLSHNSSPPVSHHPRYSPLAAADKTLCRRAGFCVCDRSDRSLAAWRGFVHKVERWLRLLHRKQNPARSLVRSGQGVLELKDSLGARHHWHLAYTNMKSGEIYIILVALEPASEAEVLYSPAVPSRRCQLFVFFRIWGSLTLAALHSFRKARSEEHMSRIFVSSNSNSYLKCTLA